MLDLSLTDEQQEIRHLAQRIALDHLRPQGRDAETRTTLDPLLLQVLIDAGLLSPFAEEFGGSGPISAVTYALIAEELGVGNPGLTMHIIASLLAPLAIALAGNEQQQAQYLPSFSDPKSIPGVCGSLAYAEDTGSYTLVDIATTLKQNGQNYLLNGSKRSVIHGQTSTLRVALLRSAGTTGLVGLAALILPEQIPGMDIHVETQQIGLLAAPSASYTFRNALVPAHMLLGSPNDGGALRIATLALILRAAIACGTARAALEYASAYATQRETFGRPIASYQGIAFMLAEMAMHLDAARLLLWLAATEWDREQTSSAFVATVEAAYQQAVKIAQSATTDAVQILGGAGFMQDHPVEMWMRDALAME